MPTDRNPLKAGVFIIASIALILAVIVGIKGVGRFLVPMQHAAVSFTLADDIGGLSPGDEVRVGGAKVGIVRSVEFADGAGQPSILVRFTVPRRFVLHKDAAVSIQSTVTGVSVLNFTDLGSGEPLASNDALTGRPSALSALLEKAPVVVGKVDKALDNTNELVTHIRGKVDPVVERYYGVADSGKRALEEVAALFGDTKADLRTTVANLREATGTVKEKLPGVMDKVDGLLTNVSTTVQSTNAALTDVKAVAENTREISVTVREVLSRNRGKIDGMIASLKSTGDNLKNASMEIRHSPWRLLYKPAAGEVANLNLYDSARQFAEGAGHLNDAAVALRDALTNPEVDQAQVQKLVQMLDEQFANFNQVEQQLWQQVKQ